MSMHEINKRIEKENEKRSWAIAIGLHAVFFIVSGLGLFSCWKQPDPVDLSNEISIIFGKTDLGSGDNTEPAENPVIKPSEVTPEEQSTSNESVDNTITDTDSDISTPDVKPDVNAQAINNNSSNNKPVENNKPEKPKKNEKPTPEPSKTKTEPKEEKKVNEKGLFPGDPGNGPDEAPGDKGNPDSKMNKSDGGPGESDGGGGKGPKIDGWAFVTDPSKPSITTPGIAHIKFTINAFGKVMTAKVIGGAFSAAERAEIVKEFKKISLRKTANVDYKTMYSGTYDWNLQY